MNTQLQRMKRLLEVGRTLNTITELRDALLLILDAASELTNSLGASILDPEPDEQNLRFLVNTPELQMLQTLLIPIDESIAGLAFRNKETVVVNDIRNAPRHSRLADELSGIFTYSVVACPILFRGEALGILEVINKANGANYTGEDVMLLETLAAHAAIAIQNAHLQQQLEETREEAKRLDKMKTDFIAITSHELRTPLGLILGHSTFLRELVSEEYHEQLDTIIRNAMRLKEIIDSMTRLHNVQSGVASVRRRTVSVRKLILDSLAAVRKDAESKGVTLGFDIENSDLMIEGDAEKIGVSILNILQNGVAFTERGGYVFVTAEEVPGYVKIAIKDNGIGIPAKDLPHIFERFYQVESHLTRKHGGMGLGLSVAKMNIELMGGRIWAESTEGQGSTFTILLPLDADQARAADKVFIN
ncbi:MAG: ATP-binding protein [Anaerolineales bacterium]|nr:ATP-binding protein [Anaerolineales bacterium]MCX7753820.1 ATP-binding protein [Anaerolineales bacterium]MDW8276416.1 ATP-binding protein [Anaerolineales bacterium]